MKQVIKLIIEFLIFLVIFMSAAWWTYMIIETQSNGYRYFKHLILVYGDEQEAKRKVVEWLKEQVVVRDVDISEDNSLIRVKYYYPPLGGLANQSIGSSIGEYCSKINSLGVLEECVNERFEAIMNLKYSGGMPKVTEPIPNWKIEFIGFLECNTSKLDSYPHYLRFEDGTKMRLPIYPDCQYYNGKKVQISGEPYQCGYGDECIGIILKNIESLTLAEKE